jgi:hypothetical protein
VFFFMYYIYFQSGLLLGAPGIFLSGGSMEYDSTFSKPVIATPLESYKSIPVSGCLGEQYFFKDYIRYFRTVLSNLHNHRGMCKEKSSNY